MAHSLFVELVRLLLCRRRPLPMLVHGHLGTRLGRRQRGADKRMSKAVERQQCFVPSWLPGYGGRRLRIALMRT